ncbi:MAG: hypothetical protein SF182_08775 [Deltaproteobacteria bacterium]|nr:hypothetical protein [Deltaproteobacteria bacterium]
MSSDEPVPFSIRLLRRFNWLIRAILRSPLHRGLSADLLVLAYTGPRSGRRFALPLSYAEHDGRVYVCTRNSRWWRNLRGGAPVEVWLRGARRTARPTVLDAGSDEARLGLRLFVTKHPRTGELLYNVPSRADGRPLEADIAREVQRSTVVRIELAR